MNDLPTAGGHALAEVDLELLDRGDLDEDGRGDEAHDDAGEQAVGTGVGGGDDAGGGGGHRGVLGDAEGAGDVHGLEGLGGGPGLTGAHGVGEVGDGGIDGLREHDDEAADAHHEAGDGVAEALVLGEAVADDAAEEDGREGQGALGDGVSPVLGGSEAVAGQEQREHDVVDKDCDAGQDVDGHDGGEAVAQRPQVHLVADLRRHFGELVEEGLTLA